MAYQLIGNIIILYSSFVLLDCFFFQFAEIAVKPDIKIPEVVLIGISLQEVGACYVGDHVPVFIERVIYRNGTGKLVLQQLFGEAERSTGIAIGLFLQGDAFTIYATAGAGPPASAEAVG